MRDSLQGVFFGVCRACKRSEWSIFGVCRACKGLEWCIFGVYRACKWRKRVLFHCFTVCKLPARSLFHCLHSLQTLCEGPFWLFHGLQTTSEGPFSLFACAANSLRGSFSTLCMGCKVPARGIFSRGAEVATRKVGESQTFLSFYLFKKGWKSWGFSLECGCFTCVAYEDVNVATGDVCDV